MICIKNNILEFIKCNTLYDLINEIEIIRPKIKPFIEENKIIYSKMTYEEILKLKQIL